MTTSIFIRTYDKDAAWLRYSLKSIQKFCSGFLETVVTAPPASAHTIVDACAGYNVKFKPCDSLPDDYLGQQLTKLNADKYCAGEFITHVDSDCVFTTPTRPEDLFDGNKPIFYFTPYSLIETPWQPITSKALKTTVSYEYMRRMPLTFPRASYQRFREYMRALHNKEIAHYIIEQPNKEFSEFNAIGAYCHQAETGSFTFVNTHENEIPPARLNQFWSWGGVTQEIQTQIEEVLK